MLHSKLKPSMSRVSTWCCLQKCDADVATNLVKQTVLCSGLIFHLLYCLLGKRDKSWKSGRKVVGCCFFFFFLPQHFLYFHLDLPLLNLVCLCSVSIGTNMSALGLFMTAFDAVSHSGHFMLVLIQRFFSCYKGRIFGEMKSTKIWCLTTLNIFTKLCL